MSARPDRSTTGPNRRRKRRSRHSQLRRTTVVQDGEETLMRAGCDGRHGALRHLPWILGACLLSSGGIVGADEKWNVAPHPGFEIPGTGFTGWYPVGGVQENGPYGVAIDPGVARSGQRSLKITPGPARPAPGVVFYPSHNG